MCGPITRNMTAAPWMWGAAKDVGLNFMLGLFLFDGHPDSIDGNYQQFVRPRRHAATSPPSSSATKIRK